MAKAYLYVMSGKKLDKDKEEEIRDKLAGKKFDIALSADTLDDNRKVSDSPAVEKSILKVLTNAAPLLKHAQKFVFKPPVKEMGDCKLFIETETQKAFDCTLKLDAPAKIKEKSGSFTIDLLSGKAAFSSILLIRALKAMMTYTVRHPNPAEAIKDLMPALKKLESDTLKEAEKSIGETMAVLDKGLKAEGSSAMAWKDAKKHLDDLNKDMQRILESVSSQGDSELGKVAEGLGGGVKCSVVAMNSKFQVLGHVKFAGGGGPSANEKSIKPLLKTAQEIDSRAKKLDGTLSGLVEVADDYYAAQQRAEAGAKAKAAKAGAAATDNADAKGSGGEGKTAAPAAPSKEDMKNLAKEIGDNLGSQLAALENHLADTGDALEEEYKHVEKLTTLLEKMKKAHSKEKADAKSPEDKKDHAQLTRTLELISKKGEEFVSTLKDCMNQCEQLEKHAQRPACFRADVARKIQDTANTLESKQFAPVTKKLRSLCADAVEMMQD